MYITSRKLNEFEKCRSISKTVSGSRAQVTRARKSVRRHSKLLQICASGVRSFEGFFFAIPCLPPTCEVCSIISSMQIISRRSNALEEAYERDITCRQTCKGIKEQIELPQAMLKQTLSSQEFSTHALSTITNTVDGRPRARATGCCLYQRLSWRQQVGDQYIVALGMKEHTHSMLVNGRSSKSTRQVRDQRHVRKWYQC